ncbi:hypothetical protein [Fusobacterium ulcerans]|uniref:hypothetical protein n=1 Tax=Fusobacterium ulcerans TaxID=861 RepID=UPI00155985E4|nr:hypothetical protein [Fusobacterium ulcerans]
MWTTVVKTTEIAGKYVIEAEVSWTKKKVFKSVHRSLVVKNGCQLVAIFYLLYRILFK